MKFIFAVPAICFASLAYAQPCDSIALNSSFFPTYKKSMAAYYKLTCKKNAVYQSAIYTHKKHRLVALNTYTDSTLRYYTGPQLEAEYSGDTILYQYFKQGRLDYYTYYKRGVPYEHVQYLDKGYTKTLYKRRANRYYYHDGNYEFVVKGGDTLLHADNFAYAFLKRGPRIQSLSVKYKAMPWVFAEEVGMLYSFGLEYAFYRNHSIEITANYMDHEYDAEDADGNSIPTTYAVTRSIQLGYRYYFKPFAKTNAAKHKFYVSPYVRLKHWFEYYQEGAVTNYTQNEHLQYSAGALLGYCVGGDFYFDVFIGPQLATRQVKVGYIAGTGNTNQSFTQNLVNMRFGFNACSFIGFRSKKANIKPVR